MEGGGEGERQEKAGKEQICRNRLESPNPQKSLRTRAMLHVSYVQRTVVPVAGSRKLHDDGSSGRTRTPSKLAIRSQKKKICFILELQPANGETPSSLRQ